MVKSDGSGHFMGLSSMSTRRASCCTWEKRLNAGAEYGAGKKRGLLGYGEGSLTKELTEKLGSHYDSAFYTVVLRRTQHPL